MPYNPQIHHRKSIRLKGYDYSQAGLYFITICVEGRKCLFGKIVDDEMILNDLGNIAYQQWQKLPERFKNMELDVFQIMPNHVHAIMVLNDFVGATFTVAPNDTDVNPAHLNVPDGAMVDENLDTNETGSGASHAPTVTKPKTVGDIVGAYKSLVANECLEIYKTKNERMGKLWQRNYYEHIIRDEKSYQRISDYIMNNPKIWNTDKFYEK